MLVDSNMIPKLVDELAQFKVRMFLNGEYVEEAPLRIVCAVRRCAWENWDGPFCDVSRLRL
jgi:hypothetical protein